jgi:flagellar basal-body rod modification protein FlgD
MPVNSTTDTARSYDSIINTAHSEGTSSAKKVYDAVFEDNAEQTVGFQDLFQLMINQLTNQDFLNPTDDSQYLAQMTQIANMNATQELAKSSKNNFLMGFLGKQVSAVTNEIGGGTTTETGIVTGASWANGEYNLMVNGKKISLDSVSFANTVDTSEKDFAMGFLGKQVSALTKNSTGATTSETGIVTAVDWTNGEYFLTVNNRKFSVFSVTAAQTPKQDEQLAKSNLAMSFLGMQVSALNADGTTDVGIVSAVNSANGVYNLVVNGKKYTIDAISTIRLPD